MIDPLPTGVEDGVYNHGRPLMILPFEPRAGEALFTQLFEVPLPFFGFRDRRKDNRALPLRAGCRFNAVGTRVSHFGGPGLARASESPLSRDAGLQSAGAAP
jgi:hypothetical protein